MEWIIITEVYEWGMNYITRNIMQGNESYDMRNTTSELVVITWGIEQGNELFRLWYIMGGMSYTSGDI